jgi:hypothetical protein
MPGIGVSIAKKIAIAIIALRGSECMKRRIDLEDAAPKAAGLAQFANKDPGVFNAVILAMHDGDKVKRLDLVDENVRDRLRGVSTSQHLRDPYDIL